MKLYVGENKFIMKIMKNKILKILDCAFDPEIAEIKIKEIIELFNKYKCPQCKYFHRTMKVFAFRYSSCIYEEGMVVISLHKTKKGANKAMKNDKKKEEDEWEEIYKDHKPAAPFGSHKHWDVVEIKIQDN